MAYLLLTVWYSSLPLSVCICALTYIVGCVFNVNGLPFVGSYILRIDITSSWIVS
jgi:hypothetical protein